MLALGEHSGIGAINVEPLFLLKFQKRIDLAWVDRELAARKIERLIARGGKKRSVVRYDQAGFLVAPQKMLQQDLGAQIEKICGLIQKQ